MTSFTIAHPSALPTIKMKAQEYGNNLFAPITVSPVLAGALVVSVLAIQQTHENCR